MTPAASPSSKSTTGIEAAAKAAKDCGPTGGTDVSDGLKLADFGADSPPNDPWNPWLTGHGPLVLSKAGRLISRLGIRLETSEKSAPSVVPLSLHFVSFSAVVFQTNTVS